MTTEYKNKNEIFFVDMVCPSENTVDAKYQQLAFVVRERQPEYNVMMIPIVIGSLGGGMRRVTNQIGRLISDEEKTRAISNKMVKTVLFRSESITIKVLSGLMQEE